jgi:hypothetical protein
MSGPLISKDAEASGIKKCTIYGNNGGEVDLIAGIIEIKYYESILSPTIRCTIIFSDSGYTINDKPALDGLPIVGQEKVELEILDNKDNIKKCVLYVNEVHPAYSDQNKQIITLDLVSKEFILNEQVRVRKRYDGKISDSISSILKDKPPFGLQTEKNIDSEQTVNLYNFIGNNRKPFYMCMWLAKKSIPPTGGGKGETAGYFFFETDKGYIFKSIDTLMLQEPKKKLIYNTTIDEGGEKIPPGYDGKILDLNVDVAANNIQQRMRSGLFNTRIVKFNPFNCFYEVTNQQVSDSYEKGGKELPKLNDKEFPNKQSNAATKTTYVLVDTGTLPTGNTQQQISKSTDKNLEETDILNKATMRYNSLFSSSISIMVPGEFTLSAGDTIFVDYPQAENTFEQDVNKKHGGKYLISNICHYIRQDACETNIEIVRESIGR